MRCRTPTFMVFALALACQSQTAAEAPPGAAPPSAQPIETPAPPVPPQLVPFEDLPELAVAQPETIFERDGLRVERQLWRHVATDGIAWRVRVPLTARVRVEGTEAVVDFDQFLPSDDGPWVAVNGGFYDDELRPMGLIVSDGVIRHPLRNNGGSGVFQVDDRGPRVVHRDDWHEGPTQALQSIDRLVVEGVSVVRSTNPRAAARAAVVVASDGLWVIVAAAQDSVRTVPDGFWLRWTAYSGLPLRLFAEYVARTTDATHALNLDGGGSTNLVIHSPEFDLRLVGERGTASALLLRP